MPQLQKDMSIIELVGAPVADAAVEKVGVQVLPGGEDIAQEYVVALGIWAWIPACAVYTFAVL